MHCLCCHYRPPLSEKFAPDVLQIIREAWAQDAKDRLVEVVACTGA